MSDSLIDKINALGSTNFAGLDLIKRSDVMRLIRAHTVSPDMVAEAIYDAFREHKGKHLMCSYESACGSTRSSAYYMAAKAAIAAIMGTSDAKSLAEISAGDDTREDSCSEAPAKPACSEISVVDEVERILSMTDEEVIAEAGGEEAAKQIADDTRKIFDEAKLRVMLADTLRDILLGNEYPNAIITKLHPYIITEEIKDLINAARSVATHAMAQSNTLMEEWYEVEIDGIDWLRKALKGIGNV